MFEKEAEDNKPPYAFCALDTKCELWKDGFKKGAEFGYNKALDEATHNYNAIIADYDKRIAELEKENAELRKVAEFKQSSNKANEWHHVKDGDLPEVDNRIVLCVCGDGYIDGKRHYTLKLLTRKEFSLFQPVYYWKEIVLPKENE